ncbi:MAG: hypothetical protein IT173_17530 [Acidobacteria bacterium]|nr:hypothetical protein [Acidobacteriota bacterium]
MHDQESRRRVSLSPEKVNYFRWRDDRNGYEDCDSYTDEDQRLRRNLRITAADEIEWRQLRESEFRVEF